MLSPDKSIRLTPTADEAAEVVDPSNGFPSFRLPPFPLSQSAWLMGLGDAFFGKYQRGITAILCLDIATKAWAKPVLPTQRCHDAGSSFRLELVDFENLSPSHRIAGSFQIGAPCSQEDAQALVPEFDGLHFVMSRRLPDQSRHCFVRACGRTQFLHPEAVMNDDWREYLLHHRERFAFA